MDGRSVRFDVKRVTHDQGHSSTLFIVLSAVLIAGCILIVTGAKEVGTRTGHLRRVVCLDPGHSSSGPASIIDPVSGLDVADCAGEPGELRANWGLALKVKARLMQAGYTVRLTKKSMDSYVDLKTRAYIGNTCSIMVRLHRSAFAAIFHPRAGQFKAHNGKRVDVDPVVARESTRLALVMYPYLKGVGVPRVMDEMGGNSNNTGTAYVVSALSRVPVVLVENDPSMLDTASGQERVAAATFRGINAYFNEK